MYELVCHVRHRDTQQDKDEQAAEEDRHVFRQARLLEKPIPCDKHDQGDKENGYRPHTLNAESQFLLSQGKASGEKKTDSQTENSAFVTRKLLRESRARHRRKQQKVQPEVYHQRVLFPDLDEEFHAEIEECGLLYNDMRSLTSSDSGQKLRKPVQEWTKTPATRLWEAVRIKVNPSCTFP